MNEILRRALADANLTPRTTAEQLGVDPKTVERWLAGRTPYPRHRTRLATLTGRPEHDLWPALPHKQPSPESAAGVLATYPHRWAVPRETWRNLFQSARQEIDILVYSGLFLAEDTGILRTLTTKARNGVKVRILLGDPDSPHVAERGQDEGVGEALAAKIRNALVHYQGFRQQDGAEIRLHNTILYASIYRADNELLVNHHLYGLNASHAPVLYLRKTMDSENDLAGTYLASFEKIWNDAKSLG